MSHRLGGALAATALLATACASAAPPAPTTPPPAAVEATGSVASTIPATAPGAQLQWFLDVARKPPIPVAALQEHFSADFLRLLPPEQLNAQLAQDGGAPAARFLGVVSTTSTSIEAEVDLGAPKGHVVVSLSVDADGRISELLLRPPPLAPRAVRGLPPVALPAPTGQHPVGTETVVTTDASRAGRRIPVQLWYPTTAADAKASVASTYALPATSALLARQFGVPVEDVRAIRTNAVAGPAVVPRSGRLPVIVFSPGLGVARPLYSGIAAELASHGYVVAVMDHPGDGQLVEFPDGTTVPGTPPADEGALAPLLGARVADARAVLDLLQRLDGQPGATLSGALDLGRISFVGHSFGGATAAEAMRLDRRFQAGVNLDGTMYGTVLDTGLDRPFLLVSSDHPDGEDDESWAAFRRHTPQAREVLIAGSAHMSFTDQPALASLRPASEPRDPAQLGTLDPVRSLIVQSAHLRAFLDELASSHPGA